MDKSVSIAFNKSHEELLREDIQNHVNKNFGLGMSIPVGPLDRRYQAGIIWPVMGSSSYELYGYNFIPIVKAPGYIYFTKFGETSFERAMASILKLYPLLLICFLMSIIAGFIIWIIETFGNKVSSPIHLFFDDTNIIQFQVLIGRVPPCVTLCAFCA